MNERFKAHQVKIVGYPSEDKWAQSFLFENNSWEFWEKHGVIFGIVSVEKSGEREAGAIGKEILSSIETDYSSQEAPPSKLELLKNIVAKELSKAKDYSLEISLGLLYKNALYLCGNDLSLVLVKRGEKSQELNKDGESGQIWSYSGLVYDNDLIILGTKQFKDITQNSLYDALSVNNLPDISETIIPLIHNAQDSSTTASLITKLSSEKIEEEQISPASERNLPVNTQIVTKRFFPGLGRNSPLNKKRLMVRTIAVLLFLIFIGMIVINIEKRTTEGNRKEFEKIFLEIKSKNSEALADLSTDPQKAKDLLLAAKKLAEEEKNKIKKGSPEEKDLNNFLSEINKSLLSAQGISSIKPDLFYDLTLIKDKASGDIISLSSGNLLVLDRKNSLTYLINYQKKSGDILSGPDITKGVSLIFLSSDTLYLFNKDKGVYKFDLNTKKSGIFLKKDSLWKEIADFASFSGNLYLLDKKANQVWKYIAADSGFSDARKYFNSDVSADLSQSSNMFIDGAVWIASANNILKFMQGASESFSISGLAKKVGTNLLLWTDKDSGNLYILDKEGNRVVVLKKDGTYLSQYQNNLISQVVSFTVDEAGKKIFLLLSNKIYTIKM